ncbi:MAG: hypothetical protein IJG00_02790 [Clostridia bacterium]|nr:hypothetical protein [Clostridia bacterium]
MKNKFLKISSLILSIVIMYIPYIHAGGFMSKPATSKPTANMEPYIKTVSDPANQPWYAADGGKAYYNAWHYIDGEAFEHFLERYSNIINNTTSATTLNDSLKDNTWRNFPTFGNAYEFLTFEWPDTALSSKFLVRVDAENRIIYTIRKNGDEYLCKFYIAFGKNTEEKNVAVCLSYNWIVNSESPIKNILLPIDRELLD